MKKPTKKKATKKPAKLTKAKLKAFTNKIAPLVEKKFKAKLAKSKKGVKARNEYDPYASGTWDVDYMIDEKGKVSANFFNLTPKEQVVNRKQLETTRNLLTAVELHAESVEEAIDQMKFKK